MARLQSAYEGGKAPHARSPVLVRRGPEPRSSLHTCMLSTVMQLTLMCRHCFMGLPWKRKCKGTLVVTVCWCTIQSNWQFTVLRTAAREAVWAPHDQSAFREQHVVTATFSADSGHVIAAFSAGNLGLFSGATCSHCKVWLWPSCARSLGYPTNSACSAASGAGH